MSAIKPTARDNQAVALLDHPARFACCDGSSSVVSLSFQVLGRSDESPKGRRLSFKTAFADFTNLAERHDNHAASYAPAAAWRASQCCLNDSNVENTCFRRRRPQMSKLEMLTPQKSHDR